MTEQQPKYELIKISSIEKTVNELIKRFDKVHYDVTTTKGMELAKKDRAELRTARVNLETARKEEKADVLERGKYIDAKAKSIGEVIAKYEDPLADMIKAEEDKKEAIRLEKQRLEQERIANIQKRIAHIQGAPAEAAFYSTEKIAQGIANLTGMVIGDEYGEYKSLAETAKTDAIAKLQEIHDKKRAEEEEVERLRIEREQFEAEKAEQERIRKEQEAEAAAKLAEEQEKLRLERESFEKEQEIARQKAEAERAEQERVEREIREATEKIERDKQEAFVAEERRKADELLAAEREKERLATIEAEKKRVTAEAERKAADKKAKLLAAKCKDATTAFKKILDICKNKLPAEAIPEIALIAEANI